MAGGILQHFQAFLVIEPVEILVTEPVEVLVTEPVEVLASSFLCSREESTPAQRQYRKPLGVF
jgi:hypothetical protein